ncbi:MAG: aminotransferase class I/II-fold pyridoxal phosphate-dependent enzyme [Clostridia bacterium]|nr:aminotransferase class I/II-fold pyridoxal phosphate-dependent enzyme [Clostridia bacterium]
MQALLLAAGMGKRLEKFTKDNTKCMVEVAGRKLIDRAIEAVRYAGIKKMIVVVGYKGDNLVNYIKENYTEKEMEFFFIDNKDYAISNNIYSFYLAKEYLMEEDTVLLESDLIYDKTLIKRVLDDSHPDVVTVAKYKSWMDGTLIIKDEEGCITQFVDKKDMDYDALDIYYKTVNIYKFSKTFLKNVYFPFLEAYMKAYGLNSYYETPLKIVAHIAGKTLHAYEVGDLPWYEIDDEQDLDIADVMFSAGPMRYDKIISKFGGYWRYDRIVDFCYLVNPYFPPKKMVSKMKQEFPILLAQYPSGLSMQNMNAGRVFHVDQTKILVGNGAAELINVLGRYLSGKVAVALPTFNEYVRCFRSCDLTVVDNSVRDYRHDLSVLKTATKDADALMIVNPDNPSGHMLDLCEVLDLAKEAEKNNCVLVVDESFVDFAQSSRRFTLLDNDVLDRHKNLIVIKSVSKSFGVPGLRLGVLATADENAIAFMRREMQVWNVNSFAEYYLQIYNLYEKTYRSACDKIANERQRVIERLSRIPGIKVYPSEANYVMVDLKDHSSYDFCVRMLDAHDILMKDLSSKNYFFGKNFIRVAIRDREDNDKLLVAMQSELI